MSVRIVRRGKAFQYDIRIKWPEGGRVRERGKCPVTGKDAAKRWAEAKERAIYAAGKASYLSPETVAAAVTVPTLADFWPRVLRDHYEANRKKASTVEAAKTIYKVHLAEALGAKPLHLITTADVSQLKGALAKSAPKTVNNVLSVLSRILHCAVDWEVIPELPCRFGLLKVADGSRAYYELSEYRRLVEAATKCGLPTLVLVLLAGSAGLRRGEIIALKWSDLDFTRRHILVERAIWGGVEDTPKGGRSRPVPIPMTPELYEALRAHRHLVGERVLYTDRGEQLSNREVRKWMSRAQARANLKDSGQIHILRHTFCSHLAIAGVSAKAIQELAGHADLKTTLRYMHLSPANRSNAMATLASFYADGAGQETAETG